MRRDDALLLDMLVAARRTQKYTGGMTEADFFESEITQSAVMREIIVIGEAAGRVSADAQDIHPEISWREIAALRNRSSTSISGSIWSPCGKSSGTISRS